LAIASRWINEHRGALVLLSAAHTASRTFPSTEDFFLHTGELGLIGYGGWRVHRFLLNIVSFD
jgi:hypothetical protein